MLFCCNSYPTPIIRIESNLKQRMLVGLGPGSKAHLDQAFPLQRHVRRLQPFKLYQIKKVHQQANGGREQPIILWPGEGLEVTASFTHCQDMP